MAKKAGKVGGKIFFQSRSQMRNICISCYGRKKKTNNKETAK